MIVPFRDRIVLGLLFSSLAGCFSPPDLPVPAREDVIISGVTVLNPSTTRRLDHSIVIRDGRIR